MFDVNFYFGDSKGYMIFTLLASMFYGTVTASQSLNFENGIIIYFSKHWNLPAVLTKNFT